MPQLTPEQIAAAEKQPIYDSSIKEAYGMGTGLVLSDIVQKQSSESAGSFIFYKSGRLKNNQGVNTLDDSTDTFGKVNSKSTRGFIKAIKVTPSYRYNPHSIHKNEFTTTPLDKKSPVVKASAESLMCEANEMLAEKLKALCDRAVDVRDNPSSVTVPAPTREEKVGDNYVDTAYEIPEKNLSGDATKTLEENKKEFKKLIKRAIQLAKGKKVKIFSGIDGYGELTDIDEFINKDYSTNANVSQTGKLPGEIIQGAVVEVCTEYDEVFYPTGTETKGYISIIIESALGRTDKGGQEVKGNLNYIPDERAFLLDPELCVAHEVIDEEGVFYFEYKKA